MSEIYLNNKLIGEVDESMEFARKFRDERRKGNISPNSNILFDEQTQDVFVYTEKGRVRRPLLVVKDGTLLLTDEHIKKIENSEIKWEDLVREGIIEYVDAAEEENCLVEFFEEKLTDQHTHLEISPLSMLGLATSLVPYGNFNQSTRLNAGSKNQKQAIGFYASNFAVRLDMDVNILHYPQRPIVQSDMHDVWDYDKHPAGQNVVVAIMSYKGYNMEDAIIINRASLDRGFGRSTYFRPSIAEELRYAGGLVDEVSIPERTSRDISQRRIIGILRKMV